MTETQKRKKRLFHRKFARSISKYPACEHLNMALWYLLKKPADKFDWRKGAGLAFDRLWNSQKKAEKKPEVREVKRYANPGEYIKIVNAEGANGENYHDGDILLVVEYYEGERDGWVNAKGANVVINPNEYVVLEGYRP